MISRVIFFFLFFLKNGTKEVEKEKWTHTTLQSARQLWMMGYKRREIAVDDERGSSSSSSSSSLASLSCLALPCLYKQVMD